MKNVAFCRTFGAIPLAVALLALSASAAPVAEPQWARLARRLTGESEEVRGKAIAQLRTMPKLAGDLRTSLEGPYAFLALDVATALEMKEMAPALLRYLPQDPTGYSVHALNTIVAPSGRKRLLREYRERLGGWREVPAATRVAILDSLSRASDDLPVALARKLLRDRVPEVRSSALEYVRSRLERGRGRSDPSWSRMLAEAFGDRSLQVRAQAHFALRALRASNALPDVVAIDAAKASCSRERVADLLVECARLWGGA
jgi:hypothetical protein